MQRLQGRVDILLSVCFAFEAELDVVVHAIEYAWSFSWRRLWLESDLAYLVGFVQAPVASRGGGAH